MMGSRTNIVHLKRLIDTIDHAAKDSNVAGIILQFGDCANIGNAFKLSQIYELREALNNFKQAKLQQQQQQFELQQQQKQLKDKTSSNSDKEQQQQQTKPTSTKNIVVGHVDDIGNSHSLKTLYMLSACDPIHITPLGTATITATLTAQPFIKSLLNKYGIEPVFETREEYKTAPNIFTKDGYTKADREQHLRLLTQSSDMLIAEIAASRGHSIEKVKSWFDKTMFTAKEAVEAGIVDGVCNFEVTCLHARKMLKPNNTAIVTAGTTAAATAPTVTTESAVESTPAQPLSSETTTATTPTETATVAPVITEKTQAQQVLDMYKKPKKLLDSSIVDLLKYMKTRVPVSQVHGIVEAIDVKAAEQQPAETKANDAQKQQGDQKQPAKPNKTKPQQQVTKATRVALIALSGDIREANSDEENGWDGKSAGIEAKRVAKLIRKACNDPHVKALILRIDSPGGSAMASETINREIEIARKNYKKKVIVSMASVCASGGYWISMNADKIVCNPFTITGSIGVVVGRFEFSELIKKLGVSLDSVQLHDSAKLFSPFFKATAREKELLGTMIDECYSDFLTRVAAARKLELQTVAKIAKGQVYLGNHAQELKLVDTLGGLNTAIAVTRSELGLKENAPVRIVPYTHTNFLANRVMNSGIVHNLVMGFNSAFVGSSSFVPLYMAKLLNYVTGNNNQYYYYNNNGLAGIEAVAQQVLQHIATGKYNTKVYATMPSSFAGKNGL